MADANLLDLQRRVIALVIASGVQFPGDVWSTVDMRIGGGLYVGSVATDPPADDINLDGDIRGAGGAYFGALGTNPSAGTVTAYNAATPPWFKTDYNGTVVNVLESTATDGIVGTTSNHQLLLYSNNATRAIVHPTGDMYIEAGLMVGNLATDPNADDIWADLDGRFGGGLQVGGIATDPVISTINTSYQFTLTGALSDEFYCGLQLSPSFTGGFTITRHNYITLNNPVLAGGAAVTSGCVFRFNANIATHKSLIAGTTHPHINQPEGWMLINVNGVVYNIPIYSHTT